MAYVEQAIFTSAVTDRSAGYQVVARSSGVCDADARELAVWCPSHDSLLDCGPEALSDNFHPLPSGAFCVSRTTPAGWEYSGRGGHRIYTHCLIIPPEALARFANNPFAVFRAAAAGGLFTVYEQIPARLEPLLLAGSSVPVDQNLLARLAANPGPKAMAHLVQAARGAACLALVGEPSPADLMAGLLACLPPQCRTEFSLTTGLKFSSRRPFRLMALSDDPAEQRWLAHQSNVQVIDLGVEYDEDRAPLDGWSQLIGRVLATGRTSFLAAQLPKRRFDLSLGDLPALGLQLLEDFEAVQMKSDHGADRTKSLSLPADADLPDETTSGGSDDDDAASELPSPTALRSSGGGKRLGHAAHRQFAGSTSAASPDPRTPGPAAVLEAHSPEVLEQLERLDDVVYEAINGRADALRELQRLWAEAVDRLGGDLLSESRAQYLRYALSLWDGHPTPDGVRNAERAVTALDVLSILFDQG